MNNNQIQSLSETLVEMTRFVYEKNKRWEKFHAYYGNDSMAVMGDIIHWAKEFEKAWDGVAWGIDTERDWIEELWDFTQMKLNSLT